MSTPPPRSFERQAAVAAGCDELTRARVRAAGAGDRRAQRWLAEAVIGDVRAIARSLCRETVDADDAAQFAVMQVLRAASGFRGESGVRHWSRRVATRAVLKFASREQARSRRELSRAEVDELPSLPSGPAAASRAEALPRALRSYLAELPRKQAEALVLRYALGYAIDEIAELSGISRNTVKSRLRLGVRELRRLVRQETLVGARPSDEVKR